MNGLHVSNSQLVSTGTEDLVKIWSMASYELLRSVQMHDHAITVRDLLDGMIVMGGKDGNMNMMCVWIRLKITNVETGGRVQ